MDLVHFSACLYSRLLKFKAKRNEEKKVNKGKKERREKVDCKLSKEERNEPPAAAAQQHALPVVQTAAQILE